MQHPWLDPYVYKAKERCIELIHAKVAVGRKSEALLWANHRMRRARDFQRMIERLEKLPNV